MLIAVAVTGLVLTSDIIVGFRYYNVPTDVMSVAFTPPDLSIEIVRAALVVAVIWAFLTLAARIRGADNGIGHRIANVNSAHRAEGDGGHSSGHSSVRGHLLAVAVVLALVEAMKMRARALAKIVAGAVSGGNVAALSRPS
jgi:hypothetical protein